MKSVKIYSIHYNRPEFILWQYDSFQHHLTDLFEFIVINNAKDPSHRSEIDQIANQLSITCLSTHSDSGLAGKHHVDSFNQIWQEQACLQQNNYVMMMDGDCFLIKKFSINHFMKNYILSGPKQQRANKYHYLTPSVIIADIDQLPNAKTINWEGLAIDGVNLDTGGGLYLYFLQHPEIKEKTQELKSSWHITQVNNNKLCVPNNLLFEYQDQYNIEFFGNEFLHYCRSSNWDHQSQQHHLDKSRFVKKFVYGTIDNSITAVDHNFQIDNREYFGWGE